MQILEELIPTKKVHFIGIGGVGMSALAHILIARGYSVSGSDLKQSRVTDRLKQMGVNVFLGHSADNIPQVDIVVYSSCISKTNPEIKAAREKGISLLKRGVLLGVMMAGYFGIAVSGAHGKTTTTAMISYLLNKSKKDPSFAVGADVEVLGGNAQFGNSEFFVAEADESDGSFLELNPTYAIITNIDKEHLDYYRDLDHIIRTYIKFTEKICSDGVLFCNGEDSHVNKVMQSFNGKVVTFGLGESCDVYAADITCQGKITEFSCVYQGKSIGNFSIQIPGIHNVRNALAAIAVGKYLEIEEENIRAALNEFRGVDRRFEVRHCIGKITIVDDYAHHPTEIKATVQAAKQWQKGRVVGVFQPHRYSRTKFLKEEFGRCFSGVDHLVITDVYAASESPSDGAAAKTIYEQIIQNGQKDVYLLAKDKVNAHLVDIVQEGDILMMLGAGDINMLVDDLAQKLSSKK